MRSREDRPSVRVSITSEDKKTGKIARHVTEERKIPRIAKVKFAKEGTVIGEAHASTGLTISFNYQTVRLDAGVTYPYPMRPGHIRDIEPAYDEAYELLGEILEKHAKNLDSLVRNLAGKYR